MDNVDARRPTDAPIRNTPGGGMKDWQLYQPVVRFKKDEPSTEIGIKASDGTYFPYTHGESTVFIRDGHDRIPMIQLADGSRVGFDQWRATRREGVRLALNRVGGDFAYMYMILLKDHSHLEQLDISTSNPEEHAVLRHTAGFWQRPTKEKANSRIIINAEPGKTNFESLLKTREISARRAADLIGITFEELKERPELLGMFIFFHEVGHADDYLRNYHMNPGVQDPSQENYKVRKAEMDSLPVPSFNPVTVRRMFESGKLAIHYAKYKNHYEKIGISSAEDLMNKHEVAYHNLPSEFYADRFAALVLRKHAERLGIEIE